MGSSRRSFIKAIKKELRTRERLVDATNAYNQAQNRKRDKGIAYYYEAFRKEIYDNAKSMGFSPKDLEIMSYYLGPEHWNQDEIYQFAGDQGIDAVDLFYKAEQYLNANMNMQKKSFTDKVYDTIALIGDHLDERGDTNDN